MHIACRVTCFCEQSIFSIPKDAEPAHLQHIISQPDTKPIKPRWGERDVFKKVFIYGLPIYLYFLEIGLRHMGTLPGEIPYAGPSLATAGIGFLAPCMKMKPQDADDIKDTELRELVKTGKMVLYSKRDEMLSDLVLILILLSLVAWAGTLYANNHLVDFGTFRLNLSMPIGCVVFLAGIICDVVKEPV